MILEGNKISLDKNKLFLMLFTLKGSNIPQYLSYKL